MGNGGTSHDIRTVPDPTPPEPLRLSNLPSLNSPTPSYTVTEPFNLTVSVSLSFVSSEGSDWRVHRPHEVYSVPVDCPHIRGVRRPESEMSVIGTLF